MSHIFICETLGSDDKNSGTRESPFQTPIHAISINPDAVLLLRKSIDEEFVEISNAALKKAKKGLELLLKKQQKANERSAQDALVQLQLENDKLARLEAAKSIVLINPSTPFKRLKIRELEEYRESRVCVYGWVHRSRSQGKELMFLVIRDGTGFLQCVFSGMLCNTVDALDMQLESTVCVFGLLTEVKQGKSAPGGHELIADYWHVIGKSPGGQDAFTSMFNNVL